MPLLRLDTYKKTVPILQQTRSYTMTRRVLEFVLTYNNRGMQEKDTHTHFYFDRRVRIPYIVIINFMEERHDY
jgi:hypothetical protein